MAVTALGDARIANRQYRQVLLTADVKLLRTASSWVRMWSAPFLWMRGLMLAVPVALLMVSLAFLLTGNPDKAKGLLEGAIGVAVWSATPFLPIYTPMARTLLRLAKWAVLFDRDGADVPMVLAVHFVPVAG